MKHQDIDVGYVHKVYNWTYANAGARTGATVVSGDVGKVAFQADTSTLWLLKDITPTWLQITTGVASPFNFVDEEVPSGTMNGSNTAFTLAHTPISGSLQYILRDMVLSSSYFSVTGTALTAIGRGIPNSGDDFIVRYRY